MARSFWKDHTDSDMLVLKQLLRLPLWQVPVPEAGGGYTLASIQAYIWSLSGRSQPPASAPASIERGYLVLDYHWQVWTYLLTAYIIYNKYYLYVRPGWVTSALTRPASPPCPSC